MATVQKDRILQGRGQDLFDRDGGKIGSVEEIYRDFSVGDRRDPQGARRFSSLPAAQKPSARERLNERMREHA